MARGVDDHGVSARLIYMEAAPIRVVLTYRDFEALPADRRRYELHDGELVVARLAGADRGCLPPFSQLGIAADTLWP